MKRSKQYFWIISLILFLAYGALSATPIPEPKLKVVSGKMLFTLTKKTSSGYDPSMTEFASMTGLANQMSGYIDMKEKTFDIMMDVSLESFALSGKFKFANNRMHETHLESSKFSTANYKGTIVSYDPATGKAKVTGKMTVHGVTKDDFALEGQVVPSKSGKGYVLTTGFDVNLNDFKIEVPNTKLTKVKEVVEIKMKIELLGEK